jgi:hypothetical protein
MNVTTVGVNIKYVLKPLPQLSVVAGANTAVAGRNVGQATAFDGSLFYVFDFNRKEKKIKQPSNSN